MYNSLILSSLNYGILVCGYNTDRLFKVQKRAVRVISKSKFNAHTDPLFQNLQILKIEDIHKLNVLKLYYKLQYWFSKMGQAFSVGLAPANAG